MPARLGQVQSTADAQERSLAAALWSTPMTAAPASRSDTSRTRKPTKRAALWKRLYRARNSYSGWPDGPHLCGRPQCPSRFARPAFPPTQTARTGTFTRRATSNQSAASMKTPLQHPRMCGGSGRSRSSTRIGRASSPQAMPRPSTWPRRRSGGIGRGMRRGRQRRYDASELHDRRWRAQIGQHALAHALRASLAVLGQLNQSFCNSFDGNPIVSFEIKADAHYLQSDAHGSRARSSYASPKSTIRFTSTWATMHGGWSRSTVMAGV